MTCYPLLFVSEWNNGELCLAIFNENVPIFCSQIEIWSMFVCWSFRNACRPFSHCFNFVITINGELHELFHYNIFQFCLLENFELQRLSGERKVFDLINGSTFEKLICVRKIPLWQNQFSRKSTLYRVGKKWCFLTC